MFVYFCPPVRMLSPNNEVVVFQLLTGTAPDLGSVANYTYYSIPPAPPVSTFFLGLLISPLYLNAPPSLVYFIVAPLSYTCSPPPLPERNAVHLDAVPK